MHLRGFDQNKHLHQNPKTTPMLQLWQKWILLLNRGKIITWFHIRVKSSELYGKHAFFTTPFMANTENKHGFPQQYEKNARMIEEEESSTIFLIITKWTDRNSSELVRQLETDMHLSYTRRNWGWERDKLGMVWRADSVLPWTRVRQRWLITWWHGGFHENHKYEKAPQSRKSHEHRVWDKSTKRTKSHKKVLKTKSLQYRCSESMLRSRF